jgi:hypothetical protein
LELVERVGSYVGFAAFLGLAILALLYFSQARDVRRLRDWAGRAPERAMEQGDRATEVAPATPAAQASEPRKRKPLRERIRNVHIPYARYIAMGAAGLLVAGGIAFGIVQLTGDDGGTTASSTTATGGETERNGERRRNRPVNVDPSQVTVAVLNGTTVQGLAAQVAEEARADGFTPGTTGNAARIDQNESEVLYRPGQARAARAVANRLGINRTGPVDSVNQEIAGSFDVVVLVGTDRQ